MAMKKNKQESKVVTKADVILQREAELAQRQSELAKRQAEFTQQQAELSRKQDVISSKLDRMIALDVQRANTQEEGNENLIKRVAQENIYLGKQSTEMYEGLKKDNASMRQEFTYISAQAENIYTKINADLAEKSEALSRQLTDDVSSRTDDLFSKLSSELAYMTAQMTSVFDKLDQKIEESAAAINEKIDALAKSVADEIEARAAASAEEEYDEGEYEETVEEGIDDEQIAIEDEYFNYDELAARITERLIEADILNSEAVAERVAEIVGAPEIDYEELAIKVADAMPPQEVVSADYIASRVAEQIVIPEAVAAEEELEEEPAEETAEPEAVEEVAEAAEEPVEEIAEEEIEETEEEILPAEIDYDVIAEKIAEKMSSDEPAPAAVDYEALAELIAQKVIASMEEEYTEEDTAEETAEEPAEESAAEEAVEETAEEETAEAEETAEEAAAEETAEEPVEVEIDYDLLADKIAERITIPELPEEYGDIDYDLLADKIAERITEVEVVDEEAEELEETAEAEAAEETAEAEETVEEAAEEVAEETAEEVPAEPAFDYDLLADKIYDRLTAVVANAAASFDEKALAEELEELPEVEETAEEPVEETAAEAAPVFDVEALADDIAHKVNALTNDEFDIVVDDAGCDTLAAAVAQKIDYDLLAEKISEKLTVPAPEPVVVEQSAETIDNYELASIVADTVAEKVVIDEDAIADKVAAVLLPNLPAPAEAAEVDYDEICGRITDKISEAQAEVNYDIVLDEEGIRMLTDAIAAELVGSDAAEFEGVNAKLDEINAKLDAQPAVETTAAETVSVNTSALEEKVDGIYGKFDDVNAKLDTIIYKEDEAEDKAELIYAETEATENGVNEVKQAIEELKDMLAAGAGEIAATTAEAVEEEPEEAEETVEEEVAEEAAEEPAEEQAEAKEPVEEAEETTEEPVEEVTEEAAEEPVEQTEEEPAEEELIKVSDIVDEEEIGAQEEDEEIAELFEDVDEQPAEGEIVPDGIEGISNGGVDFANMMKYNRSFIARIIQGSDDVKNYYGQVKNAMLSYKKVNSSIAWGAERFNKGRETIAKFKIRGKTLCLYLNLDPNEYKTSVYHHVDVSDNKSMHGTPMMVKIKSPLGVRKAIRLIDDMLAKRNGEKRVIQERDYAAMYPYETIEELIEDGLVKDVSKNK